MATKLKLKWKILFKIFMQSLILYFLRWIMGVAHWNVQIIEEPNIMMFSPVFQIPICIDLGHLGLDLY